MNRVVLTSEMIKRAWEIDQDHQNLTRVERTKIFNDEFGTSFNQRTIQQAVKNYNEALESNIKADEVLVRREINVLKNQKKVTMMKKEIHSITRKEAMKELVLETFDKKINDLKPVRLKPNKIIGKLKETDNLVIAKGDDHFRGLDEDIETQRNFYKKVFEIAKQKGKKRISLIFGGDECEGWLHVSSLTDAPKTPEEQMILFIRETMSGIDLLASEFLVDVYYLNSSNHTQTRPLGSGRNTYLKADTSIYGGEMLKLAFRDNKNVTMHIGGVFRGRDVHGLANKKVGITHGGLKFESNVKELVKHYSDCDFIIKAHTHTFKIENILGTTVITVPTLKTFVTGYELDNGFLPIKENLDKYDLSWDAEFLEIEIVNGKETIVKHKV